MSESERERVALIAAFGLASISVRSLIQSLRTSYR